MSELWGLVGPRKSYTEFNQISAQEDKEFGCKKKKKRCDGRVTATREQPQRKDWR